MKTKLFCAVIITCLARVNSPAEDITTLDGQKYENVRSVSLKPDGLFFVTTSEGSPKGVKIPFNNLSVQPRSDERSHNHGTPRGDARSTAVL